MLIFIDFDKVENRHTQARNKLKEMFNSHQFIMSKAGLQSFSFILYTESCFYEDMDENSPVSTQLRNSL